MKKIKEETIVNNYIPETINIVSETEKRNYRKELWI